MKRAWFVALFVAVLGCAGLVAQSNRTSASESGRYVFYPVLEAGRDPGNGILLDTATGRTWVLGLDLKPDGSRSHLLIEIAKSNAK